MVFGIGGVVCLWYLGRGVGEKGATALSIVDDDGSRRRGTAVIGRHCARHVP